MSANTMAFREAVANAISQTADDAVLIEVRGTSDRRTASQLKLPFITEEGLVMVDRREQVDRRRHGAGTDVELENISGINFS